MDSRGAVFLVNLETRSSRQKTIPILKNLDIGMPMKRKYIMFAMLILASACLTLAGYMWVKKVDTFKERAAISLKQSDLAFQKYFNADYDSAKEIMLNHIRLLDKFSAESENPVRNPFASDATFWFVRLAKLEGKNNQMAEKARCMDEALSRYASIYKTSCSAEYLQQQVERMDDIALKTISAVDKTAE